MAVEKAAADHESEVRRRLVAILPRLRRFCHGLARSRDQGDDLLQATVERALARHQQWQASGSLEGWVFRMAVNLNIDLARAQRVRGVSVELEACQLPGEDELARHEFRSELEAVRAALSAMPPEFRAVMTAVVFESRSYREAAELLDLPIGTVMSRLSRARRFIKAYIDHGRAEIDVA